MGSFHVALTRVSLHLMGKGYFPGKTAPVRLKWVVALLKKEFPDDVYAVGTCEDYELVERIAIRWKIPLTAKRPINLKRIDELRRGIMSGKYAAPMVSALLDGIPGRVIYMGLFTEGQTDAKNAEVKAGETILAAPVQSNEFLKTFAWRKLRMEAIKKHGARCQCCGASPRTGAVINVDHIKPRVLYPELALELSNLQILCSECNHGKGNWDSTDWRDGS